MFASVEFFAIVISVALLATVAFTYVAKFPHLGAYFKRYFLAVSSFLTVYFLFESYAVLFLVGWFYTIIRLKQIGFLSQTGIGLVCLISPLVLVKFGALSPLAIIGLSFMTFRAVDVLVNAKEKPNTVDFFSFIVLPFVVITGPMYRWKQFNSDFESSFLNYKKIKYQEAWYRIALGVVQKFLLADWVYQHLLTSTDAYDYSFEGIAKNALYYSLFLLFDFAGYSNMAMGCGHFFGLNLPPNFNWPILAKNPKDFWQRWHISLSQWLRDMIFMPLYMHLLHFSFFKKHKLVAQNIGIFSTLLVMGIWNGPNLRYVISGALFGTYSVAHNLLLEVAKNCPTLHNFLSLQLVSLMGRIVTLILVSLSLYVFSGRSFIH